MSRPARKGLSLLELVVAIGVIATLVALLIPAVQKVRIAALRMKSANKMRQLGIGLHTYADRVGHAPVLQESIPDFKPDASGAFSGFKPVESPLFYLVKEFEPTAGMKYGVTGNVYYSYTDAPYQSPADPFFDPKHAPGSNTWTIVGRDGTTESGNTCGTCSYVANAAASASLAAMHSAFKDGTSNTVYLAETYSNTPVAEYDFRETLNTGPFRLAAAPNVPVMTLYTARRRATFADGLAGDVYPITSGSPAVAVGKFIPQNPQVTGETMFQCGVPPAQATGKVPYSPYPNGLQVGMADGSVRMIRVGVAESVFWGSVTPAGGEVANLD